MKVVPLGRKLHRMNLSVTSSMLGGSTLVEELSARQRSDIARQRVDLADLPRPDANTPRPADRIDGLVKTAASQLDVQKNAETIFQRIKSDRYMIDVYA